MSDITANVVISMPSQLFTMARSFKAVANGKIYIGQIDTDPTIPANQIQVYLENEDGSLVPMAQPIIINAGGYPVYNGQIAKFVTVQGHSMAVYDAYGVQQFYFPNLLKYDPDQLEQRLYSSVGFNYIGEASYADIRSQSLSVSKILCYGRENIFDGGRGVFCVDNSDTTSPDNDGTILVDSIGRRWKRQYVGAVYAKWFGVKANGIDDDTISSNNATKTLQHVIFPTGTIPISSPIIFGTQTIEGEGTYPNGKYGTIFQCLGDHAAFEHSPTGYQPGGILRNFWINYQSGKPTITTGNAKGVNFGTSDASIDPETNNASKFIIENVIVIGAYYGFYDVTSTYLMEYRNCWAWDCYIGFVKDLGTTIKYSSCYSLNCYGSWRIRFCHCPTFENCAYDGTSIIGSIVPFYAGSCPGLTINGMQHESSKVDVAGRSDMVIEDCRGFSINGMSIPSWVADITDTSEDAFLIDIIGNSTGNIGAFNLSESSSDVFSKGANVHLITVRDSSRVDVSSSILPKVTGSAASYSLHSVGNGILNYNKSVAIGAFLAGDNVLLNGLTPEIDFPVNSIIPANGVIDAGTKPLPGLVGTDILSYSTDFTPTGCSIIPMFISNGNVSITIVNHLATPKSLTGTVKVRATKI
ncbi:phage tailspike protein [Citrobacter freundii]|uniref:phage tailspike protein n=1 Tax=Citrobacter freundii TaxID=546 RepID=UPI0023AF5DD5|nr:phage tailspike protein [Citrobacter freundii]MDE8793925.1 phage tailspike protein [Citrobacter freundii]